MSSTRWPWKPEQVGIWLKQAFSYDPRAKFEGRSLRTLEVRNWPALYLAQHDQGRMRRIVEAWAWCLGSKQMSFRAMCEQRGWKPTSANREVDRALQLIADGLNRDAERANVAAAQGTAKVA